MRVTVPPSSSPRLNDARGGDVTVRPGLVSEAPAVRLDPSPLSTPEGGLAQFKIVAAVRGRERPWLLLPCAYLQTGGRGEADGFDHLVL